MHSYASSQVKRKSFYRKSEPQLFLLIFGGHIGAPKLYCTKFGHRVLLANQNRGNILNE